jgi:Flp pilus assembly protein TadB
LQEQIDSNAPFRRFPNGAPSERTLEKTKERLQAALNAKAEIQKEQPENPGHKPLLFAGIGALGLGVLLAIIGLAGSFATAVMLVLGGLFILGGCVAFLMGMKKRDDYLRRCAEDAKRRQLRKNDQHDGSWCKP